MSKNKSTRARSKEENPNRTKVPALRKVFFLDEHLHGTLQLENFHHPGKDCAALFATRANTTLYELLHFDEPRRSWLIDNSVCSNGGIYLTLPFDATFLALSYLRKHCTRQALSLDSIHEEGDVTVTRLLTTFVQPASLAYVADVKSVGDTNFYKYNAEKALAWLAVKTTRLALVLRTAGVYCGQSAKSQNYTLSEKSAEEPTGDDNYMRLACDLVGDYMDLDLHEELKKYLDIAVEPQLESDESKTTKRKRAQALNESNNKKCKTEGDDQDADAHNESFNKSHIEAGSQRVVEKTLSTKQKALAKSAKGSKSIASFFKM